MDFVASLPRKAMLVLGTRKIFVWATAQSPSHARQWDMNGPAMKGVSVNRPIQNERFELSTHLFIINKTNLVTP